jgi:hypothetical protein
VYFPAKYADSALSLATAAKETEANSNSMARVRERIMLTFFMGEPPFRIVGLQEDTPVILFYRKGKRLSIGGIYKMQGGDCLFFTKLAI